MENTTSTPAPFIDYLGNALPVDLDGDPYIVTEYLGAWKMTRCCGAAVSASDPDLGLYCKACYGEAHNDGPANLMYVARAANGRVVTAVGSATVARTRATLLTGADVVAIRPMTDAERAVYVERGELPTL